MKDKLYRIMIIDRSEMVQSIIAHILKQEIKKVSIVTCDSAEKAMKHLEEEKFDLITTSVLLPGLDGFALCRKIRQSEKQHLTPVIVVSSDADKRMLREGFSAGVTDYFNKSLGYQRLLEFLKDVLQRHSGQVGRILYVEDSVTTAHTTQTLLEKHGMQITHVNTGEQALALLKKSLRYQNEINKEFDIVLTDFFLEGVMTGGDLLYAIRTQLHYSLQEMPVLVMTIDDNIERQVELFQAGANDFITKPVLEERLIARVKLLLLIKHQYILLKRYYRTTYKLQTSDSLTGTYNKQFLIEKGKAFISQYQNVCLIMLDIDHLEKINQTYGKIKGDHILHLIGHYLKESFPNNVIVTRLGGKTFSLLIPKCSIETGKKIAEKLRLQIMAYKPDGLAITISIGLAFSKGIAETTITSLLSDAESALRTAQKEGYNRSCLCLTQKNVTLL
jgi:diguanylate cyclase (GGDEF)-like protein